MKFTLTLGIVATALLAHGAQEYDPLRINDSKEIKTLDLIVHDADRNRDIPVLIYLPEATNATPVVLFSHGLGGSRNNNPYLANQWTARGYLCVFIQHPGSDESVWKESKPSQRMSALQKAASRKNAQLRTQDIPAVIDQLEKWNREDGNKLQNRMDLERIGMSGHSFGAVTTQSVSGQWSGTRREATDPRIKAACAFSPSTPKFSRAEQVFGQVTLPWMLMTGTKDVSPIGGQDLESRLAVYPALPAGDKYELVLFNATHSAFSERAMPQDKGVRNPNHHRAILALSTAFWDTYLLDNQEARAWLGGEGARSVLEKEDCWQTK